ncbi:UNVERIFIED_CONTAM: hypothetical protein GTU68_059126, partial [Idotea baltica]|nr:hypothetical protein [Idotea baltica]
MEPRPIQAQTLPPALAGRDVLGLAQTGTGKTAAFVLPILQRLLGSNQPGPRALVVTPTRELASQVNADFQRLAKHTKLTSTVVFGGVPASRQVRAMRQRPDIVVACPGRLIDLMGRGCVRVDGIEVLVLDEADHMFDMGFLPDLRRILKALPARRQNLLFSATMPPAIRKLAGLDIAGISHVVNFDVPNTPDAYTHRIGRTGRSEETGMAYTFITRDDASALRAIEK